MHPTFVLHHLQEYYYTAALCGKMMKRLAPSNTHRVLASQTLPFIKVPPLPHPLADTPAGTQKLDLRGHKWTECSRFEICQQQTNNKQCNITQSQLVHDGGNGGAHIGTMNATLNPIQLHESMMS